MKYKYGATRIANDHPEYEWNVHGVKELLKKIDETGSISREEASRRLKTVHTEESIELVEEIILSQEDQPGTYSTTAEIARQLKTDCRSGMALYQDIFMKCLSLHSADITQDDTWHWAYLCGKKIKVKKAYPS